MVYLFLIIKGEISMARAKQSRGKCSYCAREMTKGGLAKHIKTCAERKKRMEIANQKTAREQEIFHLEVYDAYSKDFWLHLEVNGSATLADLDHYLRAIWLECCGHMSQFSIGGWVGQEIPKNTKISTAFMQKIELTHIYDFGTSSETLIKYIGQRQGKALTKNPIELMARNNMPQIPCMECEKISTHLCIECYYETYDSGLLCDEHTKDHPHDNYGEPMPLFNSPRVGMCGYDGPAEPPY